MKTKISPAVVGLFVLGAMLLVLVALLSFGGVNFFSKPQRFVVYFDESIHGLDLGSAVKLRGVRVGRVADLNVQYNASTNKSVVAVLCEFSRNIIIDDQGKPKLREVSEHKCPVCGREMIKRRGRFGEFLGCSGYSVKKADGTPECATIINLDKEGKPLPPKPKPVQTTIKCEKCGGPMLLRNSKRGPFLGCSTFPKCRAVKSVKKLEGEDLKQAEALLPALQASAADAAALAQKVTGALPAPADNGKPATIATDIDCDECGKPMIVRSGRRGKFLGCSGYPRCKNTMEVPARLLEEMGVNGNGPAKPPETKEPPPPPEDVPTDLPLE